MYSVIIVCVQLSYLLPSLSTLPNFLLPTYLENNFPNISRACLFKSLFIMTMLSLKDTFSLKNPTSLAVARMQLQSISFLVRSKKHDSYREDHFSTVAIIRFNTSSLDIPSSTSITITPSSSSKSGGLFTLRKFWKSANIRF